MKTFEFNSYEKAMINAMMAAYKNLDNDGGFLYFETRKLVRHSIWDRFAAEGCTPYKCKELSNIMMEAVDKIVELDTPFAA